MDGLLGEGGGWGGLQWGRGRVPGTEVRAQDAQPWCQAEEARGGCVLPPPRASQPPTDMRRKAKARSSDSPPGDARFWAPAPKPPGNRSPIISSQRSKLNAHSTGKTGRGGGKRATQGRAPVPPEPHKRARKEQERNIPKPPASPNPGLLSPRCPDGATSSHIPPHTQHGAGRPGTCWAKRKAFGTFQNIPGCASPTSQGVFSERKGCDRRSDPLGHSPTIFCPRLPRRLSAGPAEQRGMPQRPVWACWRGGTSHLQGDAAGALAPCGCGTAGPGHGWRWGRSPGSARHGRGEGVRPAFLGASPRPNLRWAAQWPRTSGLARQMAFTAWPSVP